MSSLRTSVSAVVALALAGCGNDDARATDARPPDGFDRAAMLRHLVDAVLVPLHDAAAAEAAAVPAALDAYCAALGGSGDVAATETAARAAWGEAMDAWEAVDAALVGPAAMDDRALRDRVYGWPLLSTCGIDRDVVVRWTEPGSYDAATRLNNVRSLAAIEYLLHPTSTAHTCPVAPVGWDGLGASLPAARCALARSIAGDVATTTAAIADAWHPGGGDYAGELAGAGGSGSAIPSAQAAINLVSDSLFYLDRMVKDMKVGEAAGIAMNACGTIQTPCEREIELRFADRATAAIRINLRTVRAVFTGTTATADGPSFEDFLRAVGSAALADRLVANLDAAIAAADALPDSFRGALTDRYADVVALHVATKTVTDDLKSQFLTVLALDIPDDVATDND